MFMEDKIETLDTKKQETLGGAMLSAALWAIVFLELIIIYGVRP